MTKEALLFCVLALAACASTADADHGRDGRRHILQHQDPGARHAGYCNKGSCTVTVTVDANCSVTVEPYALVMGGTKPPIEVEWKLQGNGNFAAKDGIWFVDRAGRGVFTPRAATPRSYVFENSGASGVYGYDVQVEQNGKPCPILDPIGVNDI